MSNDFNIQIAEFKLLNLQMLDVLEYFDVFHPCISPQSNPSFFIKEKNIQTKMSVKVFPNLK